jgi:hypothetical protein
MPEGNHLKFNFVPDHIGEANTSIQLGNNLVSWLKHAFLEMGAWVNIPTGTTSYYGGADLSRLYPVDDPNYTDYQVWQAFRKDWVYESGGSISYPSGDPIVCSGVFVGSTFYLSSSTTGAYAHRVEFPAGRIVFLNSGAIGSGAISQSSTIKAAYSYNFIQVTEVDEDNFNQFQYSSMRADNSHFLQFGSGSWDVDWRNRVQLPAVMVQIVPQGTSKPVQLGTLQAWEYQRVFFHIFAEDPIWCKQLRDILKAQHDRTIPIYDVNKVQRSGVYPLDAYGSLRGSGLLYPQLVEESGNGGYRYKVIRFTNVTHANARSPHPKLHGALVSMNIEYLT